MRQRMFRIALAELLLAVAPHDIAQQAHGGDPSTELQRHFAEAYNRGDVAAMAETYGLELPLTADVRAAFDAFVQAGNGELDHSALLLHLEKINHRKGA